MIYSIDSIRHLHLEISSLCNAACPLCPRNFSGYPHNAGYVEHNMTLQEAQKIFPVEFIQQLDRMIINGNFGDMIMNPETVGICRYFLEHNPDLPISISTNGGARSTDFWRELAELGVEVVFCIDGIDNATHALYRQNTLYSTVMRNAETFISAGGYAIWKMIDFEHNHHQIPEARIISIDKGFSGFLLVDDGRDNGPVYNINGDLSHVIGSSKLGFTPSQRIEPALEGPTSQRFKHRGLAIWLKEIPVSNITCEVKQSLSVYISSTGDVFPCCYIGLNPASYRNNSVIGYSMEQIAQLISNNNALEHGLATCIEWFNQIEKTWDIPTFEQGRLITCNQTCGGPSRLDSFHVKNATYTDNISRSQIQGSAT